MYLKNKLFLTLAIFVLFFSALRAENELLMESWIMVLPITLEKMKNLKIKLI
jgi:hypothetical protein